MGRLLGWLLLLWAWCMKLALWPLTRALSLFRLRRRLPPLRSPLLSLSASSLAHRIRHRQISCIDVITAYIQRISDVKTPLNCVTAERFKEALEEATSVDEMLGKNPDPAYWAKQKPLLGVPVTVKGSIAVKGLPHTSGCKTLKDRVAAEDAECVKSMKEKGAIVLLVSSTPEMCLSYECFNKINGVTNNPYDTRRTPGGSSGGEGALLGAGGSVLGIGSDVAGSCRLPSLFCGIYGHKPTPGVISSEGHIPFSKDPELLKYFTIAPMCRYAEDLPLALKCLISDPNKEASLNLEKPVDFKKIKIYYAENDGQIPTFKMHSEIKSGIRKALKHFETKYSIVPVKIDLSDLDQLMEAVTVIIGNVKEIYGPFSKCMDTPDDWKSVIREYLKFLICRSKHTLPALMYGPMKKYAETRSEKKIANLLQYKRDLMSRILGILGDDGVFFFPTFYDLANFHYQFYYKLMNVNYLTLFNLLEMPVTACPIGLAKDGRPLGLQVAVNRHQDRLSFAVAKELEECFGGWKPPPSSEPPLETV